MAGRHWALLPEGFKAALVLRKSIPMSTLRPSIK
jgi:hypothetical protein